MSNCCAGCFKDPWLRDTILATGADGVCDVCKGNGIPGLPLEDLSKYCEPLVEYYRPYDPENDRGLIALLGNKKPAHVGPLVELIDDDWELVSTSLDGETRQQLLCDLLSQTSAPQRVAIDSDWIPVDEVRDYKSLLTQWNEFAYHLTTERRFLPASGQPNMAEAIRSALVRAELLVPEESTAYRARKGLRLPERPWLGSHPGTAATR